MLLILSSLLEDLVSSSLCVSVVFGASVWSRVFAGHGSHWRPPWSFRSDTRTTARCGWGSPRTPRTSETSRTESRPAAKKRPGDLPSAGVFMARFFSGFLGFVLWLLVFFCSFGLLVIIIITSITIIIIVIIIIVIIISIIVTIATIII